MSNWLIKFLRRLPQTQPFNLWKGLALGLSGIILFVGGLYWKFTLSFAPRSSIGHRVAPLIAGIGLALFFVGPLWFWLCKPVRAVTKQLNTQRAKIASVVSVLVPGLLLFATVGLGISDAAVVNDSETLSDDMNEVMPDAATQTPTGEDGGATEETESTDAPTPPDPPTVQTQSNTAPLPDDQPKDVTVELVQFNQEAEESFGDGYRLTNVSVVLQTAEDRSVYVSNVTVQYGNRTVFKSYPRRIPAEGQMRFQSPSFVNLPSKEYNVTITAYGETGVLTRFNTTRIVG